MRKITKDEQNILSESYGEIYDDLYVPEDFSEYCALSDHHVRVLHAKETAYRILEGQRGDLIRAGLLQEVGPGGYNDSEDGPTVQPWERPETSREKVLIEDPEINFLEQFPPKAHASLMSNTLFSTNNSLMRYLGPGLAGALKARKNGTPVGNFMEEVRYALPGRRRNVFDPVPINGVFQRVPNLGAKTLRPVFPDKPTPNPNWNLYGGSGREGVNKSRPKDPKAVLAAARAGGAASAPNPNPSKFKNGDVGPGTGVYVPFAHVIAKLETPFNQPRMVNGRPLKKTGQIQANLEPPDPNDPESYLPWDSQTMVPTSNLPFSTQGYKPQALDTSKNFHHLATQWTKGMDQNPELFNQRRLQTLTGKYGTTNHDAPGVPIAGQKVQWNLAHRSPGTEANPQGTYQKRGWVQDPNDVTKKVMQRARTFTPDGQDLENQVAYLRAQADKADADGSPKLAAVLRKRAAVYDQEIKTPGHKMKPVKVPTDRGGYAKGWDTDSKKLTGPGTDDPESPETYEKTKVDRSTATPINMHVRRKQLDHVYTLQPVKGSAISISPELFEEWQQYAQKAAANQRPIGSVKWENATEHPDDQVFVANFDKYQFQVDPKDRSIRATKAGDDPEEMGQVDKNPWFWASLDHNKRVEFTYHPDTETYDMPIYSPGVIDARKGNNPITYGGFDAGAPGAFEARPPKDEKGYLDSMYGPDPEKGRLQTMGNERDKWKTKGWVVPMMHAAEHGISMGIAELNGRINKSGARDSDINTLKANKDQIVTASLEYMGYNLRNGKAFNFKDGKGVFMNMPYSKRIFGPLHAAVRSMEHWQKKNPDFAKQTGFRKPMSQMPMDEMLKFIQAVNQYEADNWYEKNADQLAQFAHLPDDEREEAEDNLYKNSHKMFQVKIPVTHVKNNLHNFVATHDKGGNPIPDEGRGGFKTLNVNANTIYEMMKEARDYYWKFTAKDMVSKVWQAYFKRGDEGKARTGADGGDEMGSDQNVLSTGGGINQHSADFNPHNIGNDDDEHGDEISDDEMIRRMTGGGMGALAKRIQSQARGDGLSAGMRRHTNLMSDFINEKKKAARQAQTDLSKATQLVQAMPENMNAVAEKVAAKIKIDEIGLMNSVQQRLMKQFMSEGLPEGQAAEKMLSVLADEYGKAVASQYKQAQDNAGVSPMTGRVPDKHAASRKVGDKDSPQAVMDRIADTYDVHANPDLAKVGKAIAMGDPRGMKGLEILQGSGEDEEKIDGVVTYYALQHLLHQGQSMDDKTKRKALAMIDNLRNQGMMFDYGDAAYQLLMGHAA